MNLKWVAIGTGLLVVLALAGYFATQNSGDVSRGREGESLLGDADISAAARIVVSKGKEKVTLVNSDDGWLVRESADFEADQAKVKGSIFQLLDDKLGFRVTAKPEKLAALGLSLPEEDDAAADSTVFTVFDSADKELYQLILGNSRDTGPSGGRSGRGGRYVRVRGEPEAYLSSIAMNLETKPEDWLNRDIAKFDESAVKAIRIIPSSGASIEISRESEDKPWQLAGGGEINKMALDELTRQVRDLEFVKLGDPTATPLALGRAKQTSVDIELFDRRTYKLKIGETKIKDGESHMVTVEAVLDSAVTDEKMQSQLQAYKNRFHGRVLAVYDFDVKPFLKARKEYLDDKK